MSCNKNLRTFLITAIALNLLSGTSAWAGKKVNLEKDLSRLNSLIETSKTAEHLHDNLLNLEKLVSKFCILEIVDKRGNILEDQICSENDYKQFSNTIESLINKAKKLNRSRLTQQDKEIFEEISDGIPSHKIGDFRAHIEELAERVKIIAKNQDTQAVEDLANANSIKNPAQFASTLEKLYQWVDRHCALNPATKEKECNEEDYNKIEPTIEALFGKDKIAAQFNSDTLKQSTKDENGALIEKPFGNQRKAGIKESYDAVRAIVDNQGKSKENAHQIIRTALATYAQQRLQGIPAEYVEKSYTGNKKDKNNELRLHHVKTQMAALIKWTKTLCSTNMNKECTPEQVKAHLQKPIENLGKQASDFAEMKTKFTPRERQKLRALAVFLKRLPEKNLLAKLSQYGKRSESEKPRASSQTKRKKDNNYNNDNLEDLLEQLTSDQRNNLFNADDLEGGIDANEDEEEVPPVKKAKKSDKKDNKRKPDSDQDQNTGKASASKKKKPKDDSEEETASTTQHDLIPSVLSKYFLGFEAKVNDDGESPSVALYGQVPEACAEHFVFKAVTDIEGAGCKNTVGFKISDKNQKGRQCIDKIWKDGKKSCGGAVKCVSLSQIPSTKFEIDADQDVSFKMIYLDENKDIEDANVCKYFPKYKNGVSFFKSKKTKKAEAIALKQERREQAVQDAWSQLNTCRRTEDELPIAKSALGLLMAWNEISPSEAAGHERDLESRTLQILLGKLNMGPSEHELMDIRDKLIDWAQDHRNGSKDRINEALRNIIQQLAHHQNFDEASATISMARSIGQSSTDDRILVSYQTDIDVARMKSLAENGWTGNSRLISSYFPMVQNLQRKTFENCRGSMNFMENCAHSMQAMQEVAMLPYHAREVEMQNHMMRMQTQQMIQQAMYSPLNGGMNGMYGNNMMGGMNGMAGGAMPGMHGMHGMNGMYGNNMMGGMPMMGSPYGMNGMYGNNMMGGMNGMAGGAMPGMPGMNGMYGNNMMGGMPMMGSPYGMFR